MLNMYPQIFKGGAGGTLWDLFNSALMRINLKATCFVSLHTQRCVCVGSHTEQHSAVWGGSAVIRCLCLLTVPHPHVSNQFHCFSVFLSAYTPPPHFHSYLLSSPLLSSSSLLPFISAACRSSQETPGVTSCGATDQSKYFLCTSGDTETLPMDQLCFRPIIVFWHVNRLVLCLF